MRSAGARRCRRSLEIGPSRHPAHGGGVQPDAGPAAAVRRRPDADAGGDQPRPAHPDHLAAPAGGVRRGRGDQGPDAGDAGRDAAMVEGTLAFAREEATSEPTRVVDLAALIESTVAGSGRSRRGRELRRPRQAALRLPPAGAAASAAQPDRERRPLRAAGAGEPGSSRDELASSSPTTAPASRRTCSSACSSRSCGWRIPARPIPAASAWAWRSPARSSRGHGGDIVLHNSAAGGLEATLTLPPGGHGAAREAQPAFGTRRWERNSSAVSAPSLSASRRRTNSAARCFSSSTETLPSWLRSSARNCRASRSRAASSQ